MSKKDKNILGKSSTVKIKARMKVLEDSLKKSGNQLGIDAGLGNATVDGWSDNQIDKPTLAVEKFLKHYNINPAWWGTGEGDIYLSNNTDVHKIDNKEENDPGRETVYKTIVEGHTEYVLIPRSVLNETQLISTRQIEKDQAFMTALIEFNRDLLSKIQGAKVKEGQ